MKEDGRIMMKATGLWGQGRFIKERKKLIKDAGYEIFDRSDLSVRHMQQICREPSNIKEEKHAHEVAVMQPDDTVL